MTTESNIPVWEQRLFALSQEVSCTARGLFWGEASKERNRVDREAILICEAITAEHSRSFYLATSLLPRDKRRAMRVLYAFCRTADNLADGEEDAPAAKLHELREGMSGRGHIAGDAILTAWCAIRTHYRIPMRYAEQLLDGVERDLVQRRYQSFEELSIYCYGVASTVGLMSMHITGFSNRQAIPYAIKLGVALQLTNILRDVGEDWRSGRLYLPLEELAAFSLGEEDVAAAKVDGRWREFMRFQINRAHRLYKEAMPGIALLHPDGRFAVAAAALLYEGILDNIQANDFNVFDRRAYVSRGCKLSLLLKAMRLAKLNRQ